MKDRIIEFFQDENKLLKVKIERLENDIKVSKAVATKLEKEVEEQDAEIERLKADIEARDSAILWLTKELDHQKAIASAELDSMHKLGDDYAKVLEEEQQHIREAKVEAVKEIGKKIIDNCHKGVISAADVLDIVVDYVKECEEDE